MKETDGQTNRQTDGQTDRHHYILYHRYSSKVSYLEDKVSENASLNLLHFLGKLFIYLEVVVGYFLTLP